MESLTECSKISPIPACIWQTKQAFRKELRNRWLFWWLSSPRSSLWGPDWSTVNISVRKYVGTAWFPWEWTEAWVLCLDYFCCIIVKSKWEIRLKGKLIKKAVSTPFSRELCKPWVPTRLNNEFHPPQTSIPKYHSWDPNRKTLCCRKSQQKSKLRISSILTKKNTTTINLALNAS